MANTLDAQNSRLARGLTQLNVANAKTLRLESLSRNILEAWETLYTEKDGYNRLKFAILALKSEGIDELH